MPIRAVFADLDGTLLNRSHDISPYTIGVLKQLKIESDVSFIVATGRPYADVIETVRLCGLEPDFIISSNGSRVHNSALQCVFSHDIPPATVRRLLKVTVGTEDAAATKEGPLSFSTNIYRFDEWLTNYRIEGLGKSYRASFQPVTVPHLSDAPEKTLEGVHSVFYYGPHDNLLPVEQVLKDNFLEDVKFFFSVPHIIDVSPPGVDKGVAVQEVSHLLGVDLADTIAFGDGMNDLPMLQAVGKAYVMANAAPCLIAAMPQTEVIASNEEDGVAKKLGELIACCAL